MYVCMYVCMYIYIYIYIRILYGGGVFFQGPKGSWNSALANRHQGFSFPSDVYARRAVFLSTEDPLVVLEALAPGRRIHGRRLGRSLRCILSWIQLESDHECQLIEYDIECKVVANLNCWAR